MMIFTMTFQGKVEGDPCTESAHAIQEYVVKQLLNGFQSGPIRDRDGIEIGSFYLVNDDLDEWKSYERS